MSASWLAEWWNVIFLAPLALALVYLFVYSVTGWTFGDDLVGTDVVGGDGDTAEPPGGAGVLLGPLGLDRVPLSLGLLILLLIWGVGGFATNVLLRPTLGDGASLAGASVPIASVLALGGTAVVCRSLARWLPLHETYASARRDLVGRRGVAVSRITDAFGRVRVRDAGGELFDVGCRLPAGRPPLSSGSEVVIVGYDDVRSLYDVVPFDSASTSTGPGEAS